MVNRVGDWAFLIGLFLLFWVYGNLDFQSIFSLTPLINERVLTLIGACLLVGAMAKSAQLGLHVWLPNAMEGRNSFWHIYWVGSVAIFDIWGISLISTTYCEERTISPQLSFFAC
jgi:NADH:ubiquinone oxidoreductase subunit 4 (subunit M)